MPSPTQHYGWTIPAENADPWYQPFDDLVTAIDNTVSSLQQVAVPRVTTVVSLYPSGTLNVSSAQALAFGSHGNWVVCSVAGMGRVVGSFSLVASGAQVAMHLTGTGFFAGVYGGGSGKLRWRCVLTNDVGVNSIVIPSNSAWSTFYNTIQAHQTIAYQAVASLGPGNYSCELQAGIVGVCAATSVFNLNNDDHLVLTALEARRP
jgi:hypothetical protein